jgi:toxin ParE1/3/4
LTGHRICSLNSGGKPPRRHDGATPYPRMSGPRPRFTSAAHRDLRAILQCTTITWGQRQATVNALENACATLAIYPHLGKLRPEIAPELHGFPVEHLLILYRVLPSGVLVLCVVHSRMDLALVSLP